MSDDKPPSGFVSLKTIAHGPPDAAQALAEIRQIYFRTSPKTIDNDFAHAIALLKTLPDDASRSKAHVYMEGLAEMRNEWGGKTAKGTGPGPPGKRKRATGRSGGGGQRAKSDGHSKAKRGKSGSGGS